MRRWRLRDQINSYFLPRRIDPSALDLQGIMLNHLIVGTIERREKSSGSVNAALRSP